jgi:hypothetical protein
MRVAAPDGYRVFLVPKGDTSPASARPKSRPAATLLVENHYHIATYHVRDLTNISVGPYAVKAARSGEHPQKMGVRAG